MSNEDNKIKVFASDDNLKALGELLSNETSRKIISHLMNQRMYTNQIATNLDIRVSLVIHHLKKLEELGLLEITEKKIKRKGEKHRFFKMDFNIFITLNKTKEEVEKIGFLQKIFKSTTKISFLFLVGIGSFFAPKAFDQSELSIGSLPAITDISPLTVLLLLVICGLMIYCISKHKK